MQHIARSIGGGAAWRKVQKRCVFIDCSDDSWAKASLGELKDRLVAMTT